MMLRSLVLVLFLVLAQVPLAGAEDQAFPKSVTFTSLTEGDIYYETAPVEVVVSGTTVGEGFNHLHYYVDGDLYSMVYDTQAWELSGLTEGEHTLMVVLAHDDHSEYTDADVTQSVTFTFHAAITETFTDVTEDSTNFEAIEYLAGTGTLEGYEDGSFQPDKTVNRAELMKILVVGQGIDPDPTVYQNCYPDVTTDWYAPYVCYADEQGWVNGYPDNTFLPGNVVNKVEALKMIVNAFGWTDQLPTVVNETLFNDTDSFAWYAPYLYVAKTTNLLEVAYGDYNPAGEMNRGGVSEYFFRATVVDTMEAEAYDEELRDDFFVEVEFAL